MSYHGLADYDHGTPDRVGVLITNLGTPDAPDTPSLRRYLRQFLSDPRVVEVPRLLWLMILHGIILRVRPRRSAAAYRSIWGENGSPLLDITRRQHEAIAARLKATYGDRVRVAFAMRYGNPAMDEAIARLQAQGVRQLLVLPLYPQYSGATSGSTFDALANDFTRRRWLPDLRFISHYHDVPAYIEAMAVRIEQFWQANGRGDQLVLSYHGVPLRYLHQGDPYHCECHATSRLLAQRLGLHDGQYLTTFQSRFGREPWLTPYTDETLKALPSQGVRRVDVFCPGFAADCLETLEEIAVENRDYFLEAGGEGFAYIPALNDSAEHIEALVRLIEANLAGWSLDAMSAEALSQRQRRAGQCPHNQR